MQVKKTKVCRLIFLLAVALFLPSFSGEQAAAYNGKSITISRSEDVDVSNTAFSFYRPRANVNVYQITGLSINAVHSVEMVKGNYAVNAGDDIDFSYNPGLTYNADGYYYDTPYGIWSNQSPSCSSAKKYEVANDFSSSYYLLATAYKYEDRSYNKIANVCYNKSADFVIKEGDKRSVITSSLDGSSVDYAYKFPSESFSPSTISVIAQKPTVSIKSSDDSIISCDGMNCVAKKDGAARLTAVVDSFPAKIFINIDTCEAQFSLTDYTILVKKTGRICSDELSVSPDLSQGTADQMYWDIRVGNKPPTAPVITGPTRGSVNIPYPFPMTATDPDGDKITYGVDDDNDGAVEAWVGGYVASGTSVTNSLRWYTNGVKTFNVLAKDANGLTSSWSSYNINIGNQPPTAPVITGPSSGLINTTYTFNVVSSDLDGDGMEYAISWSSDDSNSCPIREILPIVGVSVCNSSLSHLWSVGGQYWAKSGVTQSTVNQWDTIGTKTLTVKTRDTYGGISAQSTFAIDIESAFSCTGNDFGNAVLCDGSDQNLTANTTKSLVSSCGSGKCEYVCSEGYGVSNGNCVLDTMPILISSSGQCGEANNATSCKSVDKSKLCALGNSYSNFSFNNGKWTWTCKGKSGGESVSCSATKNCSWIEVNP